MEVHLLEFVALGYVAQRVEVFERRVHATIRGKTHKVHSLPGARAVFKGALDFRILKY
jgi:hypothetical protein